MLFEDEEPEEQDEELFQAAEIRDIKGAVIFTSERYFEGNLYYEDYDQADVFLEAVNAGGKPAERRPTRSPMQGHIHR